MAREWSERHIRDVVLDEFLILTGRSRKNGNSKKYTTSRCFKTLQERGHRTGKAESIPK